MTNQLIQAVEKAALSEIQTYNSPPLELYKISKAQAIQLAKRHKAELDICILGSILADYKLGEAISKGKISDHISMSQKAALKLLKKFKADDNIINKVSHCILAHHGTIPFKSIEAEVVANADCYRFLTIRGVFGFIENLASNKRYDLDNIIHYVKEKAVEKWNIITLPDVKTELEPNYKLIVRLADEST